MMDEKSLAFPSPDAGDSLLCDKPEGLWRRVLDDETAAFEIVVQRYQNLVASVAYSATGSFSLSEEVTQETFWQAWRQRTQLRDHGRLASWLCGIARNLALQAIKQERRPATVDLVVDPSSSTHDPAVSSISAEERQLVWETLEDIPDLYREALVLFYREGHSMLGVAAALDVSTDVAKQRVHRGRELLRETLAARVEDVLVRTRPSRSLTARVMVGLAALGAALKATSTASATTLGGATVAQAANAAGASAAGGIAASGVKAAAATGASAGIMGGMLGAAGGLGGAFVGSWLPSQMAETMAERKLLEKHGRRSFALSIGFTLVMLLIPGLLFVLPDGRFWILGLMVCATLVFTVCIILLGFQAQGELRELQAHLPPDAPLNASPLRRRFRMDQVVYRGQRYTSRWRLFGLPLIDIQFADAFGGGGRSHRELAQASTEKGHACGWIAVGDQATGILFAAGGIAKGLIAFGGLAVGGIAVGGGAVGLLAIGGGALGGLAFGGLAIGYESVGGLAVAWHVATGGGAIARYLAVGGEAWAQDFAVGGGAWANEANTDAAKELASSLSKMWMLQWMLENRVLFIVATIVIALTPAALMRLAYRRCE